jgi:hypothetical protein
MLGLMCLNLLSFDYPLVLEGLKARNRMRFTADEVGGDYNVMLRERLP